MYRECIGISVEHDAKIQHPNVFSKYFDFFKGFEVLTNIYFEISIVLSTFVF